MDTRRVVKVRLDQREIASMLELPEGVRVVAVQGRFDPVSIEVILEGDSLPESPDNAEAPYVQGRVAAVCTNEDGFSLRKVQWNWPTQEQVWPGHIPSTTCEGGC